MVELVEETARAKSIVLDVPEWPGHRAGQHVDVRLTAPDGYQAQRSYSIASGPDDDTLVLTVERLDDGEVSPYLVDELQPGDELELRGPIGGYFVWDESLTGRVLLVAGGSGVVPFRAMLRSRASRPSDVAVRLLYSARALGEVLYHEELMRLSADTGVDVNVTLTREWPPDWQGHRGRVDRALLADVAWPADEQTLAFVCGPSGFVEAVAEGLVATGHRPERIRTERFGASGT